MPSLRGVGSQLTTPTEVTASTGLRFVELTWTPVTNAAFYEVFRSGSLEDTRTIVTTNWIPSTNYVDTTAQALATYYSGYGLHNTGWWAVLASLVPRSRVPVYATAAQRSCQCHS